VKTSTCYGAAGATVEDVRLMKEAVAGRAKVEPHGFTAVVPFVCFGETRRAYSAEVAIKATKTGSMSSFAKASEDTRCVFLHGFIHPP